MTTRTGIDKDVLARSSFFSNIDPQDIEVIGLVMAKRELRRREVLFRAGEEGDALAILIEGELGVRTTDRDEYIVEELEVVGEMTCVDPAPRSADVYAREDSVVGTLDQKTLLMLRESSPSAYTAIVRSISERLTKCLQWVNAQVQSRYAATTTAMDIPRPSQQPIRSERFEGRIDFRTIECLRDFSTTELEMLATHSRCRKYEAGAVLCREGAEADRCFIIASGEIEVRKNVAGHTVILGAAEQGALLGQAALVDRSPRTATLQARTEVVTIEVDRVTFTKLLRQATPVAIRFQELIATSAVRQLRSANERLGQIPSFRDIDAAQHRSSGGFHREDTVKKFYDRMLKNTGISESELESISFA
jgi:CRP-like cAMP-binding protein